MDRAPEDTSYKIELTDSIDGFAALEKEWNALLHESSQSDNPFLTFEWLFTWWRQFGIDKRLSLLTLHSDNALVGICPFMIVKRKSFRIIKFIGQGSSDYLGIIVRKGIESGAIYRILAYLNSARREWDSMCLGDISPHGSFAERVLQTAGMLSLRATEWERTVAPYISIETTWDRFLAGQSRSFRQNIRYRRTKVESYGKIGVECIRGENIKPDVMSSIWEIEKKSWKYEAGTSPLRKNAWREFYAEVLSRMAEKDRSEIWLLSIDGVPTAYHLNLFFNRRRFFLNGSYAMRYGNVGAFLLSTVIKDAFDRGLEEYHFLGGAEKYKLSWTSECIKLCTVGVHKKSFFSALSHLLSFKQDYWLETKPMCRKALRVAHQVKHRMGLLNSGE